MPTPAAHDTEITLHPLRPEHLPAVLELGSRVYDTDSMPYTGWSLTAVATHLDASVPACRVALAGERLAGFVLGSMTFEQREDWGYLEWIAVDPDFQGRGVAGLLVRECCAALTEAGASSVVTDVEVNNTASAALMRRNGFTEGVTVTLFVRPGSGETAHRGGISLPHFARTGRPRPTRLDGR
ncbi:acetyltransferase [Streptomyces sp. CB02923]|uniref:GNAT family N-acetyltransferase n=1 Tax=Streptomyces sp. CB02923 TaxID=1718985 RepID=UPI00093F94FA|nr:GNAT family N-acetyltransferase [Streptomyces sp. CB02923]OKI06306.1 acetyltransferase [Streptomyces sp. CB02923]